MPAHAQSAARAARRQALISKDGTTKSFGDANKPNLASGYTWKHHLTSSVLNPRQKDTHKLRVTKKALSPAEHDLLNDAYAPRAFGDYARNLSGTFGHVSSGAKCAHGLRENAARPIAAIA